jgi:hypothetical protein
MASNLRVLVSNLGDGNWGSGAGTENVLDNTNPAIYFPPAFDAAGNQVKGTAPSAGGSELAPGSSSVNGTWPFAGWSSKTHYIVQIKADAAADYGTGAADGDFAAASVIVNAVRPTGVKEQLMVSTSSTAEKTFDLGGVSNTELTETYGAYGSETIEGPIAYFEFLSNAGTTTNLDIKCYVIAWNYGDISDGLAS